MLRRKILSSSICTKRFFSVYLNEAHNEKPKHPFRKILTRHDVIQYLNNNVIFEDDNIVTFNKPPGIGKSRPSKEISGSPDTLYMDEIIGKLSRFEGNTSPFIVKFPEKYSSGVMIIAKSEEASNKIAKCKLRTKGDDSNVNDSFIVVSLGRPITQNNECKLAVKLMEGKTSKRRIPCLVDKWSEREVKLGKVKVISFEHEVLCSSSMASLVRVKLSATKSNALRLYLATKLLSPIIGDSIFSGRAKNVMGLVMPIDPWSEVANHPQKLPLDIMSALQLPAKDWSLVPFLAHLEEVSLPRYSGKKDLILKAPMPPLFSWVCEQLGLEENKVS